MSLNENQIKLRVVLNEHGIELDDNKLIELYNAIQKKNVISVTPDNFSVAIQSIRTRRSAVKLSQNGIAKLLNKSETTIGSYEKSGYLDATARDILEILREMERRTL
ncbi:hypothetical protein [Chroococcidiopsis sp.]|uniref:hypothetical protein n=1 Tax=Chroococcidiopsis sp. TaxID=3088168 RepID=UPI003F3BB660